MVQITIDVPDEMRMDFERLLRKKLQLKELEILVKKTLQQKQKELGEIAEYERIISKSKATDKDVEELSDKINTTMWEYHKKKYNL